VLEEITKNPDLARYMTFFKEGEIIFLEGDDSQDLYILVSGSVDYLKGSKKISESIEQGSLFGEIAFLLGGRRTATAKATEPVKALRIPKDEINSFLAEFPSVADKITRLLAHRLSETSQMLFGLREFCDQLPDAVVLTDKTGRIMTWNSAAERLYGRGWQHMRNRSMEEIYQEPETYRGFMEEVETRQSVREKILKINHPETGIRYVSTSTTVLYDGQHNEQGVLFLGRDVTSVQHMERRYRRVRNWFIPSIALVAVFAAALFFVYPYITKGMVNVDVTKNRVRDQFAKDYLLLRSLLLDAFADNDRTRSGPVLREFFKLSESGDTIYTGVVLLDREKRVFDSFSIRSPKDDGSMVGSSYAGIEFLGADRSLMKTLVLYRADQEHPMGHRAVEVAFEIEKENQPLGWLLFQMNMETLRKNYSLTEDDLRRFYITKLQS
jgi:PAS domain S-box-containing protein